MLSREENYQIALEKAAGFEGVFRSKVTGQTFPTTRRLGAKLKRLWKGPEPSLAFKRKKATQAAKDETRRIAIEAAVGAQARLPKNVLALDPRSGKFVGASARDWIEKYANMAGGGYPGSTGFGGSPGRNMTNAMNASANKAKLAPAPSGGTPMGGGNTRMMAEGGVVKKRTNAVIGEAGEEAVVPKRKVSKKTWEELKRRLPKADERRPLKDKER